MKLKLFINIGIAIAVVTSLSVEAETTTGMVTRLRTTTSAEETIYFQLNSMPSGVTQWFYLRSGSGSAAGCPLTEDKDALTRAYSMLLAAKSSSQKISIGYCLDPNGYGLVNQYVELP